MPPSPSCAPSATTLLLVGCGRMGSALLACWQQAFPHIQFHVVDPAPPNAAPNLAGYTALDEVPQDLLPTLVVLAVKPQTLPTLAAPLARFARPNTTFLSIAAGITLHQLTTWFAPAPVIRAMPNTPAAIGKGMTVLASATRTGRGTGAQADLAFELMQATGQALWADDEAQMDAVTALSGSGPAYLFALTEAMAAAGKALGLPQDMADTLARQTVIGSAALMAQEKDQPPAALREAVTSKGGTTAAALAVLHENNALQELLTKALSAAATRSAELSR